VQWWPIFRKFRDEYDMHRGMAFAHGVRSLRPSDRSVSGTYVYWIITSRPYLVTETLRLNVPPHTAWVAIIRLRTNIILPQRSCSRWSTTDHVWSEI